MYTSCSRGVWVNAVGAYKPPCVCVETHQVPSVNTHVFISYEGRSETKCNLCEKK